jgi:hypothetical protein
MNDDLTFITARQKGDYYVVENDIEKIELVRRMKKVFENNWGTYVSRIKVDPGAVPS